MSYKISIIIPVYNAAEFIIKDTLKSIENQTMDFKDIEVILINDCSSDNTEEVINNYAMHNPNIVPINLPVNSGDPAKPRNIGILYATADYLMFLDQDDLFREDACEKLYNKIVEEDVDFVSGNHMMVSNNSTYIAFKYDWMDKDEIKIDDISENPNFLSMSYTVWQKIFKRKFVLENNLKFTSGVGEDIFFVLRAILLAKGMVLIRNLIIVDYNIRTESLSHQIDINYLLESTGFYLDFFDYCDDNIEEEELYEILFNGRLQHYFSLLLYPTLPSSEMSTIFVKVQELFKRLYAHGFILENKLYHLLFFSIVHDEYPFKDSLLVYGFVKSVMGRDVNKLTRRFDQECKLYVDCGKGFNEKDSISKNYQISDKIEVVFDLNNFDNIKKLRFDPIAGVFINCEILDIESNLGKMSIKSVNDIKNSSSKYQTFITTDSQYHINMDSKDIKFIKIVFSVSLLSNGEITSVINSNI